MKKIYENRNILKLKNNSMIFFENENILKLKIKKIIIYENENIIFLCSDIVIFFLKIIFINFFA